MGPDRIQDGTGCPLSDLHNRQKVALQRSTVHHFSPHELHLILWFSPSLMQSTCQKAAAFTTSNRANHSEPPNSLPDGGMGEALSPSALQLDERLQVRAQLTPQMVLAERPVWGVWGGGGSGLFVTEKRRGRKRKTKRLYLLAKLGHVCLCPGFHAPNPSPNLDLPATGWGKLC